MSIQLAVDILGWIGTFVLIFAFGMNSFGKINAQSFKYQGLNLFAAIALIVNTGFYKAWPATFLNVVWVFIALFAMWKMFSKK